MADNESTEVKSELLSIEAFLKYRNDYRVTLEIDQIVLSCAPPEEQTVKISALIDKLAQETDGK